jgi:hypothetical protein
MSDKMPNSFIERPFGKVVLINCGVVLGLFLAHRHGYRGSELLFMTIASFVLLNVIGAVGIWVGLKMGPAKPNRFLKPLWIAISVLALIYVLDYLFPSK